MAGVADPAPLDLDASLAYVVGKAGAHKPATK